MTTGAPAAKSPATSSRQNAPRVGSGAAPGPPHTNGVGHHKPAPGTVLVVDDDPAILSLLQAFLADEGFTPLIAQNGEAALALYDRHRPAVALVDLMMPVLDGLGFVHELRRRYGSETGAIYFMSAAGSTAALAEATGISGSIDKPFDLDHVLLTIREARRGAPRRRRSASAASRSRAA